MKKKCVTGLQGIFLLFVGIMVHAQNHPGGTLQTINPYLIQVGGVKTTNIVFPYAITGVDIGSKDVLAQKSVAAANILQLKAAGDYFEQTNISVITADGKLTSFLVDYAENPAKLNFLLPGLSPINAAVALPEGVNIVNAQHYAEAAASALIRFRGIKYTRYGVSLKLDAVFVKENILLFRFSITNNTPIDYDVDQFRLYVRDLKKPKRMATQEIEIKPVFTTKHVQRIKGNSEEKFVLVVPKFTMSNQKYLAIELMEKNGGRHLKLPVRNNTLLRAKPLD